MRARGLLIITALAFAATSGAADVVLRSFDQDAVGAPPPGFSFAAARLPAPGRWLIRADGANRYLAHLSDPSPAEGFALALVETTPPQMLSLSARIKLSEGARVGGLAWRYQSPDNFYAIALDLAAQEMSLYRIARGNRIRLEFEDDIELDRDAWHTVRVEHAEGRIRVSLGGIGVMRARARDEAESSDGRAGVWSAGNATAWFDDLNVQEAERDSGR